MCYRSLFFLSNRYCEMLQVTFFFFLFFLGGGGGGTSLLSSNFLIDLLFLFNRYYDMLQVTFWGVACSVVISSLICSFCLTGTVICYRSLFGD